MKANCTGPKCTKPAAAHGLCFSHYKQVNYGTGELRPLRPRMNRADFPDHCTGPDCTRPVQSASLCRSHLQQKYRGGKVTHLRRYRRLVDVQEALSEARTNRAGSPIASSNDGGSK